MAGSRANTRSAKVATDGGLWRHALVVLGVALVLAGCGLSLRQGAEPESPEDPLSLTQVAPSAGSSFGVEPSVEATAHATAAAPRLRLWFVEQAGLAAVESSLPDGSPPDLILQALAIGPPPEQEADGLRTVSRDPLTGLSLVAAAPGPPPVAAAPSASGGVVTRRDTASDTGDLVTVVLAPVFSSLPPTEQVLLLGQVVLSLASAGAQGVAFTDDSGSPVAVPLPDGRLLDAPAVASDYADLIVRP